MNHDFIVNDRRHQDILLQLLRQDILSINRTGGDANQVRQLILTSPLYTVGDTLRTGFFDSVWEEA